MDISWPSILQALLFGILLSSFFRWSDKSRLQALPEHKSQSVEPAASVLGLGVLISGSFTVLLLLSNLDPTTPLWVKLAVGSFVLAGLPFIWAYFFDRYRVTDQGLEHPTAWGLGRRTTAWGGIQSTRYSSAMKYFELRGIHGETARISILHRGLPVFAKYVLKHAPDSPLDDTTRDLLNQTANGEAIPLSG